MQTSSYNDIYYILKHSVICFNIQLHSTSKLYDLVLNSVKYTRMFYTISYIYTYRKPHNIVCKIPQLQASRSSVVVVRRLQVEVEVVVDASDTNQAAHIWLPRSWAFGGFTTIQG